MASWSEAGGTGLKLVVKLGALVNKTDGVIVLSENAGAHGEPHEHVRSINPFDVEATAAAMHAGLTMGATATGSTRLRARSFARATSRAGSAARSTT